MLSWVENEKGFITSGTVLIYMFGVKYMFGVEVESGKEHGRADVQKEPRSLNIACQWHQQEESINSGTRYKLSPNKWFSFLFPI